MLGLAREIGDLVRIVLQIEKLRAIHLRVADELPAVVADGALHIPVRKDHRAARGLRRIVQRSGELGALAGLRRADSAQLSERGHHVEQIAHGIGALIRRDAGTADDERHAHGVEFVEVLLADQPVTAARHAAVCGKNDDRVLCKWRRLERVEHTANLRVEIGDVAVVFGNEGARRVGRARPRQQLLVADHHLAVIKRMLRQEARRQLDLLRVIRQAEIVRHDVRIMRRVERHVCKKRPAFFLRLLFQKADRLIRERLARVLRGRFRNADFSVRHIAEARVHGVCHAAREHRARGLKAALQRGIAIMPFAACECGVARLAERLRPRLVAQLFIHMEKAAPREQHRARRNARRAIEPALHVGTVEGPAAVHKTVKVRRLDDRVSERRNGIRALVVGENEEDIGPRRFVVCAGRRQRKQGKDGEEEDFWEHGWLR